MSSACLPHAICLQVTLNGTWQLSKGNRRKEAKTPVARGIFFFFKSPRACGTNWRCKNSCCFSKICFFPLLSEHLGPAPGNRSAFLPQAFQKNS